MINERIYYTKFTLYNCNFKCIINVISLFIISLVYPFSPRAQPCPSLPQPSEGRGCGGAGNPLLQESGQPWDGSCGRAARAPLLQEFVTRDSKIRNKNLYFPIKYIAGTEF